MSRRKNSDDFGDDDAGLIGKVASGRINKLDTLDYVQGARFAAGFTPVGQIADPLMAAVEGEAETSKALNKYQRQLDSNLSHLSSRSPAFKRKLQSLRSNWRSKMGEAVVSAGGSLAGMAIAGSMATAAAITGPVGWAIGLGGLMGGGIIADKAYHKVFPQKESDAILGVEEIARQYKQGQEISEATVFDVLVDNMPGTLGTRIEDKLEKATGTRQFSVAMSDPSTARDAQRIMRNHENDVSPLLTGQMPAAEQFAEWINRGEMKAKDLLDIPAYLQKREYQTLLRNPPMASLDIVSPKLPSVVARSFLQKV